MDQDVVSFFENTKLNPVESAASLSEFIDKAFKLDGTWVDVLGFEWTASWQLDFLTFQLFFQFLTLIRQSGVEGNHRQEFTNRTLFGFHPTDSFPLKKHLQTKDWKQYSIVQNSTVNKAVKLSIIRRGFVMTGKQNVVLDLVRVSSLTIRSLTFFFSLRASHTTADDKMTLDQLKALRAISEEVTESRDIHINNDWGHIISEVIIRYKSENLFRLQTEKEFVYNGKLKANKKPDRKDDKYLDAQHHLHHLVSAVLFSTQPGKEAVSKHGFTTDHVVTEEGWNNTCLGQAAWIGYNSTPHPVVSCLIRFGIIFVSHLTVRSLTTFFLSTMTRHLLKLRLRTTFRLLYALNPICLVTPGITGVDLKSMWCTGYFLLWASQKRACRLCMISFPLVIKISTILCSGLQTLFCR
jgi:hypothetical protein